MKGELTHGSLFSGIGGFDLGFRRAGIETVWQVEIDSYCRRVLAKHFPEAARFPDVERAFLWDDERFRLINRLSPVDVLSGGFPCQDISNAGNRAGIYGEQSGLWSHFARIICEVRPRFVVVENVAALLGRGMERVLGDLAACGYDAEWDCIPACALGAPHIRDRVWIVAYPQGDLRRASRHDGPASSHGCHPSVADAECDRRLKGSEILCSRKSFTATGSEDIPDSPIFGRDRRFLERGEGWPAGWAWFEGSNPWAVEPDVGRVANGVPARVDRLRGLGNAVVPQITECIGRRIIEVNATIFSEVSREGERPE